MRRFCFSIALLLLLQFPGAATHALEEPCTLDTKHFLREAQRLASSKPGARLDARTFTVSWRDRAFGRVSVSIGGCFHYGLNASSSRRQARRLNDEELRQFAANLVESLWPKPYSVNVAHALRSAESSAETDGNRVLIRVDVAGFDEVFVEYVQELGLATIAISARVPT